MSGRRRIAQSRGGGRMSLPIAPPESCPNGCSKYFLEGKAEWQRYHFKDDPMCACVSCGHVVHLAEHPPYLHFGVNDGKIVSVLTIKGFYDDAHRAKTEAPSARSRRGKERG